MPVYVHVIKHPDTRVLVDTDMTELHPAAAVADVRRGKRSTQRFELFCFLCQVGHVQPFHPSAV
jgi:N-acyl homoserine lactone hydrolase